MNAFINHFSFEFRTGIRNRALLFVTYLFPLLFYVMMGLLMTAVNPTFRETLIPAMVVFAILTGTLMSLPDPLVAARNAGILRSYRINGVPAVSILLIPALSAFLHITLLMIIVVVSAPSLFDAPLPVNWLAFVLVFILMSTACAGLGLLIGVISSSSQMTVILAQLVFLPSMILGGLMLPHNLLPEALARFAMLLPTTHAMNAFRGLAYNLTADFDPLWSIVILLAGSALAFGLSIYLFAWSSNSARQRKRASLALLVALPYVAGMLFLS